MNARSVVILVTTVLGSLAHGGSRASADYDVAIDAADAGGNRSGSVSYTNNGSAGGVAGVSTTAAASESIKAGYIAQFFDVAGLVISAAAQNINEGGTLQLAAWRALDDATFLAVPSASIEWSVTGGPLTGIDANGLASAGAVYQNTAASVKADHLGLTGTLNLTVLESVGDNFGIYAADAIADLWQVQHFGEASAMALPGVDADGDGQNNLFEFRAGTTPTDSLSSLSTRAPSLDGGIVSIELSRVQPGTRYVFERTLDFGSWAEVFTLEPSAVAEPFVQPVPAIGEKSFFRVRLEPAP